MKRWLALAGVVLIAACVRPPEPNRRLGTIEFETSCTEEAQLRIDQGVAMLHHMLTPTM